jgi:hypothetical protein
MNLTLVHTKNAELLDKMNKYDNPKSYGASLTDRNKRSKGYTSCP